MSKMTAGSIRSVIARAYAKAGWTVNGKGLSPPTLANKEEIRLQTEPHRLSRAQQERDFISSRGRRLLEHFAAGAEVRPEDFSPRLIRVTCGSLEADLFRFATLFWSIPVSRGYGRRMRYVMMDEANSKVVGILALGDPVFNLSPRDRHIGWDAKEREQRLYHVLDAYVLGAVPPYNRLLCGKLMALSALSNEIRADFKAKYRSNRTVIGARTRKASLVMITTTSALGRSSLYNRLRLPGEKEAAFLRVGYSTGWGHFHIDDATFTKIRAWLRGKNDPYADGHAYGEGPNWRFRTIRRAFDLLGLKPQLLKHGIQREVFLAPLAKNYARFLKGEHKAPRYHDRPFADLVEFFKNRWMLPRSTNNHEWKAWTRQDSWSIIRSLYPNGSLR